MSPITKSLERRIQELTASIDAQKTELAAYERVLQMELAKEGAPAEQPAVRQGTAAPGRSAFDVASEHSDKASQSAAAPDLPVKANKTAMVGDVVRSYGSQGATPKDVDAYFTAKNIQRSKNLVYNTLSYLVAQKKLVRRDGRYFAAAGSAASAGARRAPAPKPAAAPTERRLSPEGLQRIKDALKKRWAAKRAADSGSKASGKKAKKK